MAKTIELMVRFVFEVPDTFDAELVCLDVPLDNVTLLDGDSVPVTGAIGREYETMEVHEIELDEEDARLSNEDEIALRAMVGKK